MDTASLTGNLASKSTWLRGLFMLIFVFINYIARLLIFAVAIFQFICTLFTGKTNSKLLGFGQSLSEYVFEIAKFLTFNRDSKPYPFSDWGENEPAMGASKEASPQSHEPGAPGGPDYK